MAATQNLDPEKLERIYNNIAHATRQNGSTGKRKPRYSVADIQKFFEEGSTTSIHDTNKAEFSQQDWQLFWTATSSDKYTLLDAAVESNSPANAELTKLYLDEMKKADLSDTQRKKIFTSSTKFPPLYRTIKNAVSATSVDTSWEKLTDSILQETQNALGKDSEEYKELFTRLYTDGNHHLLEMVYNNGPNPFALKIAQAMRDAFANNKNSRLQKNLKSILETPTHDKGYAFGILNKIFYQTPATEMLIDAAADSQRTNFKQHYEVIADIFISAYGKKALNKFDEMIDRLPNDHITKGPINKKRAEKLMLVAGGDNFRDGLQLTRPFVVQEFRRILESKQAAKTNCVV